MKSVWVILFALVAVSVPASAKAQAAAYGEFSVTTLSNQVMTNQTYGATAGILLEGPTIFHKVVVAGDIQGRFISGNNQSLNGITIGPRFELPLKKHGFTPFGEFMVGFARYHTGKADEGFTGSTTDGTIQFNAGVAKQVSPRFDVVADFSYAQYYALGGEYNPKTYSLGAIYHFVKR